ncbi:hypothetical protein Lesp02_71340 [Lentzea sp. NBRC 105346]|nr:hypothetical protein Lesp02_71340 [Lentzea sp. NBRC 105346]
MGGLVNENVALVALDEKAELGRLNELEVLVTPVPLQDGEEVERIRPERLMVAKLTGAKETFAAIRLMHPSRYRPGCPSFTKPALQKAMAEENDIWLGAQRVTALGARMSEDEVTKALENALAAEEAYHVRNFQSLTDLTAAELTANCFINCSESCRR